jgi:ribokinase
VLARIPPHERARFVDTTLSPDANAKWLEFAPSASDMPAPWWDSVRGIHDAYMPVERHGEIAAAVRARPNRGVWMQIDSPWHDHRLPSLGDAIELFRSVQAVLPSEADVEEFRPGVGYEQTVAEMLRMGARMVAVKRGAAGSAVFERDKGLVGRIRALDVVAVDPTGAGDAFCGGFLAGLLVSGDPVTAARYGTVSASFAVEAAGLVGLVHADRSEARARLAALAESP